MEAKYVALPKEGVHAHCLHFAFNVFLERATVGDDLHSECSSDAGGFFTDCSVTENAESESVQFDEGEVGEAEVGATRPVSFRHLICVVTCSLREVENMSKGHLGDGLWSVARHIRNGNSAFGRSFAIHDVHSRGRDADVA